MQLKDLHSFRGGLNSDDAPPIMPDGDYPDAINVRTGGSDQQHGEGPAETLQSEISVLINPDSLITYYGESIGGNFVYPGYEECKIGNQVWMKKNWDANYPGSKVYGDDENNRDVYGGLYTHGQILASDFCPDGWHIPTEAEVDILIAELLGEAVAGGKLKDIGWWDAPNTGADDSSGFKGMPGGGFGMDVMYYGTAIGSDFVYDLLGSTGLLWLADEVPDAGVLMDIDGNEYHWITIGAQQWLVENLKTIHYADGTPIPNLTLDADWLVEDGSAGHDGAYCAYDNDPLNIPDYGLLYNWYAVDNVHGLAPTGWRVPSDADWQILMALEGGIDAAGGKLKEQGFTHWTNPNTDATNESGFTAVGAGYRSNSGVFNELLTQNGIWRSDEEDATYGVNYIMDNESGLLIGPNDYYKKYGFSVRCMRDI